MSKAKSAAKSQPSNEDNDDGIPPLPEKWDRCHAYNERKRRYCRQTPIPISSKDSNNDTEQVPRYCGNHRHLLDEWLSHHGNCIAVKRPRIDSQNTESKTLSKTKDGMEKSKKDRGKRVPCPIDPSHFIFEGAIAKHVLVCPAVKQKQEAANREYYSEGINLGGHGDMGSASNITSNENDTVADLGEAEELAYAILRIFHFLFLSSDKKKEEMNDMKSNNHGTLSNEQLQSITEQDIYNALPEIDLSHSEEGTLHTLHAKKSCTSGDTNTLQHEKRNVEAEATVRRLTHAITKHRIKAGGPRHLHQIASILGHVRQNGLISVNKSSENCKEGNINTIVEMGAGRGMTGLIVAGSMAASLGSSTNSPSPAKVNLCLVERSGTRGKAETKVRTADGKYSKDDDCLRLDLVEVSRVKCDLAHVDMASVAIPRSKSSKAVVIAKHLCGAGTDLALKSLRNIGPINGCVMATCCHGLCAWNEFVGRDSFLHLFCSAIGGLSSFGEKEFNLLKRWTSASVLEDRPAAEVDTTKDDDSDMKEQHYSDTNEEKTGRYPNIFTVVNELGLSCGGNGLGRACQRLIDHGRCDYLRKTILSSDLSSGDDNGAFNVSLLHYCNKSVTPQNALIVASRHDVPSI